MRGKKVNNVQMKDVESPADYSQNRKDAFTSDKRKESKQRANERRRITRQLLLEQNRGVIFESDADHHGVTHENLSQEELNVSQQANSYQHSTSHPSLPLDMAQAIRESDAANLIIVLYMKICHK
jgi:hypothetical protein